MNTKEMMSKEEVIARLQKTPGSYRKYLELRDNWKQQFLDFCTGKKTLPMLYDAVFKVFLHPDIHPDRLEDFISSLTGLEIKIKGVLPTEDSLLDGSTLLIMDILVELEDGSLADVEIQKVPYAFPAERISCYSADLLLRQYSRVRGKRGQSFTYGDIKKVCTIIIYESSTALFHNITDRCIHHGSTTFDTGLSLTFLQEYWLVALDVFKKNPYPKDKSRQNGWLSFLTTESIEKAELLIREYPWLEPIYREMAAYRNKPEEVLDMFSEALRILDRNTVQYMIDEQKKVIEENKKTIEKSQNIIAENEKTIAKNQNIIAENEKTIAAQAESLKEKEQEIQRLKQLLEGQDITE